MCVGCPFKYCSDDVLQQKLLAHGVKRDGIDQVIFVYCYT